MQKVLVAEIGRETTVVNAFGDLETVNPRLLGQGLSLTTELNGDIGIGLRLAITDLEKDIGPVGSFSEIPFYITSSLPTLRAVQKENGEYIFDTPGMQGVLQIVKDRILPTSVAIMQAVQLIDQEVGAVLVLDVGSESTDVYSATFGIDQYQKSNLTSELMVKRTVEEDLGVYIKALTLVKLIGEDRIKEHHGQDWERLIKFHPGTPEEMVLSAELTASAVTIALQRHIGRSSNDKADCKCSRVEVGDSTQIRWMVGTGLALTQLPNGLEIMRESVRGMADTFFLPESMAILLDKDCIMASLGVLTTAFRAGVWQLLRESFGVEN